jgi:hypothetical protein
MTDTNKEVMAMIKQAANEASASDAMQRSQAALNAANALKALRTP